MKISSHVCVKNALSQNYPFIESINSFAAFCHEVVVVDGGSTDGTVEEIKKKCPPHVRVVYFKWPDQWQWQQLVLSTNYGFNQCTGDIVIKFDADYLFHDKNELDFVNQLEHWMDRSEHPIPPIAFTFRKFNFLLADRCFQKSISPLAVNKRDYPNLQYGRSRKNDRDFMFAIFPEFKFSSGIRNQPIWVGTSITEYEDLFQGTTAELWVYDFTFMNRKITDSICRRAARAHVLYENIHNHRLESRITEMEDGALNKLRKMMLSRYGRDDFIQIKSIEEHPKVIHEKLRNLEADMFGFNMFGWLDKENNPDPDWIKGCSYLKV